MKSVMMRVFPIMFLLFSCLAKGLGQKANCSHPTAFFQQCIDHFSGSCPNFPQQYQVIDDHYKPGGPILFVQGAKESSIIPTWAQQLGALAVSLEHRFYGASWPSNATELPEKYETLTLENVMLDSVTFIEHIKSTTPGMNKSTPAIITGASYGGFLTMVIRLNYPEAFYGAVAWAAPARAFGPPETDPDAYTYNDYVSNVFWEQSAVAAKKIQDSLGEFAAQARDNGALPTAVASQLPICTQPTNQSDFETLISTFITAYGYLVQYAMSRPLIFEADPLTKAITATEQANNTAEVLSAVLNVYRYKEKCVDWAGLPPPNKLTDITTYFAMLCRYYPSLGSAFVSDNTIFPSSANTSWAEDVAVCPEYDILISSIPTQAELQSQYHFTQSDIGNSTRILFPQGTWDPVSSGMGPKPFNWAGTKDFTDPMRSQILTVDKMAHGEDGLAPCPSDKGSVLWARNVELQTIKNWLDGFDSPEC